MNSFSDSRNCLRRIARNDDTEFSHQSVLNAMERFVRSVNTMDETILVTCRLMDMKVGDDEEQPKKTSVDAKTLSVHELLNKCDLFDIYNMLNSIKADLLWGQGPQAGDVNSSSSSTTTTNTTSTIVSNPTKGHNRRPSTISVTSTNSSASTMSDNESDTGIENDSGYEDVQEQCCVSAKTDEVARNFRRHLIGLTRCLKQMTDTANYLTTRYQQDIGGPA